MYEGDFVNDKKEGNGKFIWKNGKYYIGEWKNNKKNGKEKIILAMEILNAQQILVKL